MPKVSIVLPFKNVDQFICPTIESIRAQTFQDWELIAVNDHSSDLTRDTVARFAKYDERIKLLDNAGTGIIPALQQALKSASGTFITRMDGDDIMPPNRLKLMCDALDVSPPKTVITGLVAYFPENQVSPGYKKYESWINQINFLEKTWQNVYRECVVASPNWMTRTAELQEIGGFDNLTYPEDYHLVFRWYQEHFQIRCIPEITLLWREHPLRTSRTSAHYTQKAFFELKIRQFIHQDLRSKNLVLWGTNEKARLTADILKQEGIEFQWMDLTEKEVPIKGIPIIHYSNIRKLTDPQLLLAVYPGKKQREYLENYLTSVNLSEGKDWWYL